MFRKLRLQLMMVNLSVILLLFLLLITGTYFFVQARMLEGAEHFMDRFSQDLVMGKVMDFPPNHGPRPIVFFVKVDSLGEIVQTSSYMPLSNAQLSSLARETQQLGNSKGQLIFEQTAYYYRVTPLTSKEGAFILFQDFERDRSLLMALVTGLSITGLVCMLLSLLGSFYMANKAMVPIKKAWQQQKDFLADASHEFRTPLAVIQTNLELVRDNPEETVQSQDHWLSNIYEETLCMTKLVESLLFLARADSHQQLLSMTHMRLGQAVFAAAELFRPIAASKGVRLSLEIKTEFFYWGDEDKLRQVVSILLDNAIRHTATNDVITVNLDKSPQGVLLTVTDIGEGINPDHQDKIFERFYQSDFSRSKGGTGLGLSIAKWIIESHEGNIRVVSTLGKGSTFKIFLPQRI